MKVETVELHGLNVTEALAKMQKNLDWAKAHGVSVLVLNHGKGHHSDRGISVIKTEIRKMLKEDSSIREANYKVIYGESKLPIALTYNEGQTLIVEKGMENEQIGGQAQQDRNHRIFSEEAKTERKAQKKNRVEKRTRSH